MVVTNRLPSIFNELRNDPFLVGFDQLFDRLVSSGVGTTQQVAAYPPYNIVKRGESEFSIEIALAGFTEDEIAVTVQDDILTIESNKDHTTARQTLTNSFLHQGIAERNFKRKWTLSPTIIVTGATFVNGLLKVKLRNEIPETAKPRKIHLNNGTAEGPQTLSE
ncbi:MAG: Hsp20 family protein [Flavobacteriales bacterium]|nr:Hsp20 family protein [Flavobacteriales bacterium]